VGGLKSRQYKSKETDHGGLKVNAIVFFRKPGERRIGKRKSETRRGKRERERDERKTGH